MDDYISRQAAIDAIDRFNACGAVEEDLVTLRDALQALPTAERHGKWIKREFPMPLSDSSKIGYLCTECFTHWDVPTNYCPNCGADMRERSDNGQND